MSRGLALSGGAEAGFRFLWPFATAGVPIRGDRFPSLDGFRAISIGLVLLRHLLGTKGFFLSVDANKHLALGELGVR